MNKKTFLTITKAVLTVFMFITFAMLVPNILNMEIAIEGIAVIMLLTVGIYGYIYKAVLMPMANNYVEAVFSDSDNSNEEN